jgi:hypothetical protein
MIMVGYSDNHSPDVYRMYNPITETVFLSRDIKLTNWERSDPTAALKALQDLTVPVPNVVPPIEQPPSDDMIPGAHIIPDDEFEDVFEPNVERNDDIPQAQDHLEYLYPTLRRIPVHERT